MRTKARPQPLVFFTTVLGVASLCLGLIACGGKQKEADAPTEAELEAQAEREASAAQDALLENDQPIDDGFESESADSTEGE